MHNYLFYKKTSINLIINILLQHYMQSKLYIIYNVVFFLLISQHLNICFYVISDVRESMVKLSLIIDRDI